ncbi:MAG: deoxyribodipyrimidine photo-lyase, partial [Marinilabiliales bacterium]|nr:deoxyribodipyrimidine photo-lyase [Marinilabiliales bacterium]
AFRKLLTEFNVRAVYANHDYEPYAVSRDTAVSEFLKESGIQFRDAFKDQVIFEKGEVVKKDGTPYTVFTPYSAAWKKR